MCIQNLKNVFFFSIGSDASNKGNKKFFPIVFRYFCKTRGVVDAVLDFYNDSYESSEAIAHRIKSVFEKNNLSLSSVSSYSADNALVNYGKHSSVYQKLKLNNSYIVQANCNCHVLNNCVKYASKQSPDIVLAPNSLTPKIIMLKKLATLMPLLSSYLAASVLP